MVRLIEYRPFAQCPPQLTLVCPECGETCRWALPVFGRFGAGGMDYDADPWAGVPYLANDPVRCYYCQMLFSVPEDWRWRRAAMRWRVDLNCWEKRPDPDP